jgi:hypothetical protein
MMPHLGVLSTVNEQAATEVFEKDCLIHLGTCVSLVKGSAGKPGEKCVSYKMVMPDGKKIEDALPYGELRVLPLGVDQMAEIEVLPAKNFDVGAGKGKPITKKVSGGVVGIVIDTRGKPITLAKDKAMRVEQLQRWAKAMDAYPE